jgi:hypothetical protein
MLETVSGKMTLKITWAGEEFRQESKDVIKIIVKLIKKGIHFQQTESGLSLTREQGVRF